MFYYIHSGETNDFLYELSRQDVLDQEPDEITFRYQDTETKVIEAVQAVTKEEIPDTLEEVKIGDNTMLIVSMIIGILVVVGIILLIIRTHRSKR